VQDSLIVSIHASCCSSLGHAGQKISGGLRSETATRNRYAIRGYASTAVKHGRGALAAIRAALAGNPWTPQVPGPP
jgi:hypothetical protein